MSEVEKKTRKKKAPVVENVAEATAEVIEETVEKPSLYKVVNCGLLNVRKEAKKDAFILKTIENNTVVDVLGEDGDFYLVKFPDGSKGYCMKDYIANTETVE